MQTPAFLWFELQVEQQCLPEIFAPSQVPAKARNLNSPSRIGARRCASVKPVHSHCITCLAETGPQASEASLAIQIGSKSFATGLSSEYNTRKPWEYTSSIAWWGFDLPTQPSSK